VPDVSHNFDPRLRWATKPRARPEDKARVAWEARIRRVYGITAEDVARQWDYQQGLCPICTHALADKVWVIEHNHKTESFRGLVCNWCNHRILSMLERGGIVRAVNALDYLVRGGYVRRSDLGAD